MTVGEMMNRESRGEIEASDKYEEGRAFVDVMLVEAMQRMGERVGLVVLQAAHHLSLM